MSFMSFTFCPIELAQRLASVPVRVLVLAILSALGIVPAQEAVVPVLGLALVPVRVQALVQVQELALVLPARGRFRC